jgi:hypothetical protein
MIFLCLGWRKGKKIKKQVETINDPDKEVRDESQVRQSFDLLVG